MYYLNLNDDAYLLWVSEVPTVSPNVVSVENIDDVDLTRHRIFAHYFDGEKLVLDEDKLQELEAEKAARIERENRPTEQEQLRADVDFLMVMGGYV